MLRALAYPLSARSCCRPWGPPVDSGYLAFPDTICSLAVWFFEAPQEILSNIWEGPVFFVKAFSSSGQTLNGLSFPWLDINWFGMLNIPAKISSFPYNVTQSQKSHSWSCSCSRVGDYRGYSIRVWEAWGEWGAILEFCLLQPPSEKHRFRRIKITGS